MTPEARRAATEELLREYGIRINSHLPMIEDGSQITLRTEEEVWGRLLALWGVVGAAMPPQIAFFKEYFSPLPRRTLLSADEATFLFDDSPSEEDLIRFSWRVEALMFLAWCAGLVEDPGLPSQASDAEPLVPYFPHGHGDAIKLREAISVRPKETILDKADLLYRLHWAVRDAQLNGREPPPGIDPGVVLEWHHAVNWMIRYGDEDDWDAVGTDT